MFNRCLLSKTPKRFTLVSFFILFIAISLFLDVIAVSYFLSLEVRPKHVFISFTFAMFTFFLNYWCSSRAQFFVQSLHFSQVNVTFRNAFLLVQFLLYFLLVRTTQPQSLPRSNTNTSQRYLLQLIKITSHSVCIRIVYLAAQVIF